MDIRPYQQALQQALDALPENADWIAVLLETQGVTGTCSNTRTCALAEYLYRALQLTETHELEVHVSGYGAYVCRVQDDWRAPLTAPRPTYMLLPPAAQDFVRWFDKGVYPTLIRKDVTVLP